MKSTTESDTAVLVPAAEAAVVQAPEETQAPAATVAKATVKAKSKDKPSSARVAEIRGAAEALATVKGMAVEITPFSTNPDSFVLRLPLFKEAVKTLPKSDSAKQALTVLRNLQDAVASLTGDARRTWVFHKSGSFALYSTIQ